MLNVVKNLSCHVTVLEMFNFTKYFLGGLLNVETKGRKTREDKSLQHFAATNGFVCGCSQAANHMHSLQQYAATCVPPFKVLKHVLKH